MQEEVFLSKWGWASAQWQRDFKKLEVKRSLQDVKTESKGLKVNMKEHRVIMWQPGDSSPLISAVSTDNTLIPEFSL